MWRRLLLGALLASSASLGLLAFTDGPRTPIGILRGRTDENGYLRISAGTAGVSDGPLTPISALRGRTDENGYLRVACTGCVNGVTSITGTANEIAASASTGAVTLSFVGGHTGTGAVPLATGGAVNDLTFTPGAQPSSSTGKVYYDTTTNAFKFYNGATWGGGVGADLYNGTITNDNAPAGIVGEVQSCTLGSGSALALTNATGVNICAVSLTAGDWDLTGTVGYTAAGTTVVTALQQSISTTSATIGAQGTYTTADLGLTGPANDPVVNTPRVRVSVATTTTVYLVVKATFSVSTLSGYGDVLARRVR